MRVRCLVAATAAALLLGAGGDHTAAAAPGKCRKEGATVVAQQGKVRVLELRRDLYACFGEARPFAIFDGASNETALGLTLAGRRYVSFVDRRIAPVDGIPDVQLRVVDVRTRKANATGVAESVGDPEATTEAGVTYGGPVRLALSATGTAVLVQPQDLLTLRAASRSEPVIVARGTDIAEVAASRDTLYWTAGGAAFGTPASAPVAAP